MTTPTPPRATPPPPLRPVYVVTTGPTLFGVHRPVPMRAGHTRSHIVGFSEEAHAQAMATSLERYRDTYGQFPPRDIMLADVVASGKFTCSLEQSQHIQHIQHNQHIQHIQHDSDAATARVHNNIVPAAVPAVPAAVAASAHAAAVAPVQVELQCLDALLARLRGTDILMAVLVWDSDTGVGGMDPASIMFQEDGFSWHVLHPSSSAEDTVAHLARAAASYDAALLPKPVRKRARDDSWLQAWPKHWPEGWFKLWAWILFAIMC